MIDASTRLAAAVCAVAMAGMVALPAAAQSWQPDKAVEIIVPTGAGGINDRLSRLLQRILQDDKLISVPAVVLNKPGANQSLAVVYMSQKASDPHHLLYTTATIFTNQIAGLTPLGYRDLTPLANFVVDYTVVTVAADSPIKSMRELVDQMKADPGAVAFGMVSRAGPNYLALAQAVRAVGVDPRKMKTVVFKTNAESNSAVIGGHIHAVVSSVSAALPQVQSGQTRMLALAAAQRAPGPIAQVPTLREQGMNATGISNWRAFFGVKGMTPAQLAYWDGALNKVATGDAWIKTVDGSTNMTRHFLRGADFAKYLDDEFAATRAVMADLGLAK